MMRQLFKEAVESIKNSPLEWRAVPRDSDKPFALRRRDIEILCDGRGVSAIDGIVCYGDAVHKATLRERSVIRKACKDWLADYKSRVEFGLEV